MRYGNNGGGGGVSLSLPRNGCKKASKHKVVLFHKRRRRSLVQRRGIILYKRVELVLAQRERS